MNDDLLCRTENGVATVTFNKPDVMNALTPEYLHRFIAVIQALDKDHAVRVIVLTGAGKAFCSGGEKGFLKEMLSLAPEKIRETVYGSFLGAARTVKLCSKPTIAAVNGPAVGAGCEIAVACDFRLVAAEAFFCENWIDLGIIPPLGGMMLLPRLIGLERASNMVMRAARVYGPEAQSIGLATTCVPRDELSRCVDQFAADLANRPVAALAIAKQGLRRGMEGTLAGEWEFNLQAQAMLIKGADYAEAVNAIDQKRKPVFFKR
jgi:enoyl-CoA hydratase/carnithine racemase